jgi:exopolysaccharide biosynthesis protein
MLKWLHPHPILLLWWVGCIMLFGCTLTVTDDIVLTPQFDPVVSDVGWEMVAPGVERREMDIELRGQPSLRAVVVRLDPSLVSFRLHYSPGSPYSIEEWRAQLPQAVVLVNGNFFDESDQTLGMLISDGVAYGQTFSGYGGMFQVDTSGIARVRSLVNEPYQGEDLSQAAQAFPMLIEVGGVMAPQGEGFDRPSRRTAVGQDQQGRIIFILTPYGMISLADFQEWLFNDSHLNLTIAFNLDGGRSTAMVLYTPSGDVSYPAFDELPNVIAVYVR